MSERAFWSDVRTSGKHGLDEEVLQQSQLAAVIKPHLVKSIKLWGDMPDDAATFTLLQRLLNLEFLGLISWRQRQLPPAMSALLHALPLRQLSLINFMLSKESIEGLPTSLEYLRIHSWGPIPQCSHPTVSTLEICVHRHEMLAGLAAGSWPSLKNLTRGSVVCWAPRIHWTPDLKAACKARGIKAFHANNHGNPIPVDLSDH